MKWIERIIWIVVVLALIGGNVYQRYLYEQQLGVSYAWRAACYVWERNCKEYAHLLKEYKKSLEHWYHFPKKPEGTKETI